MSLSSQPATAAHNSGAGAGPSPQLPEGRGDSQGDSYSPTEGSSQSLPEKVLLQPESVLSVICA